MAKNRIRIIKIEPTQLINEAKLASLDLFPMEKIDVLQSILEAISEATEEQYQIDEKDLEKFFNLLESKSARSLLEFLCGTGIYQSIDNIISERLNINYDDNESDS